MCVNLAPSSAVPGSDHQPNPAKRGFPVVWEPERHASPDKETDAFSPELSRVFCVKLRAADEDKPS